MISILINIIKLIRAAIKLYILDEKVNNQNIKEFFTNWLNLESILKTAQVRRWIVLELFINILRSFMLTYSLKFPGYNYFNDIFFSFCGIISYALAIYKNLFLTKNIIILNKKIRENVD
jgi:hypothetical protein